MSKYNLSLKLLCLILTGVSVFSCSTDDVDPALIEFSASQDNIVEASGTVTITATLNASNQGAVSIPLELSGTASQGTDYTLSASVITIPSGSSSGSITITATQDSTVEGVETIIVSVGSVQGVVVMSGLEVSISLLDDDADSDGDGVIDSEDDCPELAGVVENNGCPFLGFLINEVLYDPPADLPGDANGDGTRDANDDEFIEFYNSGPELDMSGYRLYDASALADGVPRHIFPSGTIVPANGVIVVFGGGNPTGSFGGAIVQTASNGAINMNNAGDFVTLEDASGNVVVTFDVEPLSDNPNESYTRYPDLIGDFIQHAGIEEANGALFSPGTKIDGSPF